jgi:hypothetical protein
MTAAQFPGVAPDRGHYESFYLRAVDPARPRGAWIRYTTHQRPGRPPTGSLWFTLFDAEAGAPAAVKETLPGPVAPPGAWIAIGESVFGPFGARGRASGAGRSAAWELELAGAEPPLRHLPREWMYRASLPRTKLESPLPDAVLSGWVEMDGRRVEVAGWRGMAGHNWGSEHAEQWVWLHGVAFAEAPDAWLDLSIGRVRIGPLATPWVANGALALDGERVRLGGPRRVRVRAEPGACEVSVGGVEIAVRAPAGQTVAWEYADPGGGTHHSLNCSIAEVRVRARRPGRPPRELASAHGGVYELGTRDSAHGVPLQPFPDG